MTPVTLSRLQLATIKNRMEKACTSVEVAGWATESRSLVVRYFGPDGLLEEVLVSPTGNPRRVKVLS